MECAPDACMHTLRQVRTYAGSAKLTGGDFVFKALTFVGTAARFLYPRMSAVSVETRVTKNFLCGRLAHVVGFFDPSTNPT